MRRCFIRMIGSFLIRYCSSSGLLSMLARELWLSPPAHTGRAWCRVCRLAAWIWLPLSEQGRYIAVDAADTLSSCMVNGVLDSVRFLQSFDNLILKATTAAQGEHPRVAVFGECADLLWNQGNAEASIQDEKLCNQLCERYDVDILCAYSRDNVEGVLDEKVSHICAEHSAVYRA